MPTDGDLPFDVIGFLRPVLEFLNNEGIKQACGAVFDHLFIYEGGAGRAITLLEGFISKARDSQIVNDPTW